MVNGELHLKPNMAPTSAMGDFRIDVGIFFVSKPNHVPFGLTQCIHL